MLKKKHRLGKTSDVQRAFKQGRAFFNPLFTIRFLAGSGKSRFTVVVSTKVAKQAVRRNRLKRLIREVIRLNLEKFKSGDYAIMVKPAAAQKESADIKLKFAELCKTSRLAQL
jgi:ribonuclease P protein component